MRKCSQRIQKKVRRKEMINNTINQLDLIESDRPLHLNTGKYIYSFQVQVEH